jgi:hypothetical protein
MKSNLNGHGQHVFNIKYLLMFVSLLLLTQAMFSWWLSNTTFTKTQRYKPEEKNGKC